MYYIKYCARNDSLYLRTLIVHGATWTVARHTRTGWRYARGQVSTYDAKIILNCFS